MISATTRDAIIVGGSYSGLSAALAMARASLSVLIIDANTPANRMVSHAHNILGWDGENPNKIRELSRRNLFENYKTVEFLEHRTVSEILKKTKGNKDEDNDDVFEVRVNDGQVIQAKRIVLAQGIVDVLPNLPGMTECWGRSIHHCPFCHGYEFKNHATFFFGVPKTELDQTMIFGLMKMLLSHWTKDITILTNGESISTSKFSESQLSFFQNHGIKVISTPIDAILHNEQGMLSGVRFSDQSMVQGTVGYLKPDISFHDQLISQLGCELTPPLGLVKVDMVGKTSVNGIYACGDLANPMRTVTIAISSGTLAGVGIAKELSELLS